LRTEVCFRIRVRIVAQGAVFRGWRVQELRFLHHRVTGTAHHSCGLRENLEVLSRMVRVTRDAFKRDRTVDHLDRTRFLRDRGCSQQKKQSECKTGLIHMRFCTALT